MINEPGILNRDEPVLRYALKTLSDVQGALDMVPAYVLIK